MIRLPRWFIFSVSVLFLLNPAATGLLAFYRYSDPVAAGFALGLYIAAGLLSVLYFKGLRMPIWLALINLLLAILLPLLVNLSLDISAKGSHATWYVTGVATLLAMTAVRQHKIVAWVGTVFLTVQVIAWGGWDFIFYSGLGGALGLVVAAHAISVGLDRSAKQTQSYLELAKQTEAASAAESAIRSERSKRLTETLGGALPVLEMITRGELGPRERESARLLEAELRDEIRGRNLLNEKLKASIRAARSRGIEVVVLDEGGLDPLSEDLRNGYRDRLAAELDLIRDGRVTIRAPHQDKAKVTFVASRAGTARPDVFLRL